VLTVVPLPVNGGAIDLAENAALTKPTSLSTKHPPLTPQLSGIHLASYYGDIAALSSPAIVITV
jgi:hypothetical protein